MSLETREFAPYAVIASRVSDGQAFVNLDGVTSDGMLDGNTIRWFTLKDDTRIEIPTSGVIFSFSPERQVIVREAQKLDLERSQAAAKAQTGLKSV